MKKIAYILAYQLNKKLKGNHQDRQIYYYAIQGIMFTILETVMIFSIAIIFNCAFEVIIIILTYVPLRIKFPGIHMKSPERCAITSVILFNVVGCSIDFFSGDNFILSVFFSVISGIVLFLALRK